MAVMRSRTETDRNARMTRAGVLAEGVAVALVPPIPEASADVGPIEFSLDKQRVRLFPDDT